MADKDRDDDADRDDLDAESERLDADRDAWLRDIHIAALVLTRVRPDPSAGLDPRLVGPAAVGHARRAFPVIGLGIGLVGAAAYGLAGWIGLSPLAAAILSVAAMLLLTGARAEVDLAGFAEGMGRGGDTGARGAIMSEARLGYYGIVTLGLVVALKVALIASASPGDVAAANIVAAAIAGRTALALASNVVGGVGGATLGGLASDAGRGNLWLSALAAVALILLFRPSWAGVLAIPVAAVALVAAAGVCKARLGGLTFPAFGFIELSVEMAVLVTLTAMI